MFKLNSTHIRLEQSQRLYRCSVPIIAITGSIATGKSSVSKILKKLDHAVIDADKLIKEIYKKSEMIELIATHCPKAYVNGEIEFKTLRDHFFNDENLKSLLESALYQYLDTQFTKEAKLFIEEQGHNFLFYDVPLLFEKNIVDKVDLAVTVYCPKKTQVERLQTRDNIDKLLALKIINSQMDIEEKREKSHLIIDNQSSLKALENEVSHFLDILKKN